VSQLCNDLPGFMSSHHRPFSSPTLSLRNRIVIASRRSFLLFTSPMRRVSKIPISTATSAEAETRRRTT
jgi:hypothetical protein